MRCLFVSRHNNDYDSLAPVADSWVAHHRGNSAAFLFSCPELDWKPDFRTAELKKRPEISFADIWDISQTRHFSHFLETSWRKVNADRRIRRKLLQIVTEMLVLRRFDRRLPRWLDELKPDIIAFDWYEVPSRRKVFGYFGYQYVTSWAKTNAVPLVSLPHGLVLYGRPQEKPKKMGMYDALFVESHLRKEVFRQTGGELPEIIVVGSPRYDPAWVERISKQFETEGGHTGTDLTRRITIVYFGKKLVYDFDFALQNRWLAHVAEHPLVNLIIQPHPRGQRSGAFADLTGRPNVTIDMTTPATKLIGMADMVSTLTSSVMVEAVIRNREILYPKFFNTVMTRFEEKGACISIESMEKTHEAIDAFIAGKRVPSECYRAFLDEAVFGSDSPDTANRVVKRMMDICGVI